jgi:ankyrin repeat protein
MEDIATGSLRMVRLLAHYGADLRILDDRPLRETVRLTKIDICQYLLIEGNADVNARSGAALKIASKIGNVQMVNLLLSFHADPRVDDSAALCDAVQNDRILISLQLLTTGADANAQNGRPLKTAAVTGNLPLIRALLQFGANPSIDNNGALTLACEAGKTEAFMMLAGADGVDLSLGGDAMLRAAKRLGNWELIRFLESKLRSENHQHQQEEQSYSPQGGSEKLLISKLPIGAPLSVLSPIPENKDDSAYRRVVGQKFQRPDGLRLQPVFSRS